MKKKSQPKCKRNWPIKRITDPEEQQRETYRYWASKTVGERLEAVWAATQAAYAIKLDQEPVKKRRKTPDTGNFEVRKDEK